MHVLSRMRQYCCNGDARRTMRLECAAVSPMLYGRAKERLWTEATALLCQMHVPVGKCGYPLRRAIAGISKATCGNILLLLLLLLEHPEILVKEPSMHMWPRRP